MDANEVKEWLEVATEEQFASVLPFVADRVAVIRQGGGGRLPYQVWLSVLGMAQMYVCVEIILVDSKTGEMLMAVREPGPDNECSWAGKLHIPGISLSAMDRAESVIQKLLVNEVASVEYAQILSAKAKLLGVLWYDEPQRGTTALTIMVQVVVDPELLKGKFVVVTSENIRHVIAQHKQSYVWWMNNCEPFFLDLR